MIHLPILSLLIWLPIFAAILIMLVGQNKHYTQMLSIAVSLISLGLCWPLIQHFNFDSAAFQWQEKLAWIPSWHANYALGIDGITLPLVVLTILIHSIIILTAPKLVDKQFRLYQAAFLMLQGVTIGVFSALDTLLFYFFWEGMLIPMYLCIGIWGGEARQYASVKFFLYTFFGSALLLIAIIYLGIDAGSFAWQDQVQTVLSLPVQKMLFLGFFFAFAIKVPMWPVHTWLPDAHTEAPAAGSVILAALMLKVGAYGFFRFSLPILPDASRFFATPMVILSLIAIVYIGLVALVQKDMKRLIAYSSVAHMGFVTLGCFAIYRIVVASDVSFGQLAMEGALMQMIAHGFGSGAMFLAFGLLYERYHTRAIDQFGGIAKMMPFFAVCFMIFALTNVGLPGTAGFVGEFTVILSLFQASGGLACLAGLTLVIGGAYTLWMFKRVFYGAVANDQVAALSDIQGVERFALVILVLFIFLLGLFPELVLKPAHPAVAKLVQQALTSKVI